MAAIVAASVGPPGMNQNIIDESKENIDNETNRIASAGKKNDSDDENTDENSDDHDHSDNNRGSSGNPDSTNGGKLAAQPTDEWSSQFRDSRLMEDSFRRKALLRQLLSPDGAEEDIQSGGDYPGGGGGGRGGGAAEGSAMRSDGGGGCFRKKSGEGVSN